MFQVHLQINVLTIVINPILFSSGTLGSQNVHSLLHLDKLTEDEAGREQYVILMRVSRHVGPDTKAREERVIAYTQTVFLW